MGKNLPVFAARYSMEQTPHNPEGQPLTLEQALINISQTTDPGLRYYAAWWLGKMRIRQPQAIDALLEALADADDRSPDGGFPLRRHAARALGKVGQGDPRVEAALIDCLSCQDYYVRETAAQALESVGTATAVAPLAALLTGGVEAAVAVPGKPHLVQPYNAVLEALGNLGSANLAPMIEPFLGHGTPQVQNAAARAMYQLTGGAQYAEKLVNVLQHEQLQLRRAALMDLGAVGYLPAADAIANTLAENSMKLMALRGLLEQSIETSPDADLVTDDSRRVMALMDSLL